MSALLVLSALEPAASYVCESAAVALVAGLIGAGNGAVNLAVADGGLGTGNGVAGGVIALVLGIAAVVPGRRILTRSGGPPGT